MSLAYRFTPKYNSSDPFQQFYRLSGLDPTDFTSPMSVDVDLGNLKWRVMRQDHEDTINRYLAGQYSSDSNKTVPEFQLNPEEMVASGTFSNVTAAHKHMDMPELGLRIANMHDFIDACNQEPFLRIYRASNLTHSSAGNETWSDKADESIAMRTASFGHGRQRLDMCLREEQEVEIDGKTVTTVADDLAVPFAIIVAHRLNIWETGSRKITCGD